MWSNKIVCITVLKYLFNSTPFPLLHLGLMTTLKLSKLIRPDGSDRSQFNWEEGGPRISVADPDPDQVKNQGKYRIRIQILSLQTVNLLFSLYILSIV